MDLQREETQSDRLMNLEAVRRHCEKAKARLLASWMMIKGRGVVAPSGSKAITVSEHMFVLPSDPTDSVSLLCKVPLQAGTQIPLSLQGPSNINPVSHCGRMIRR